ncbi:MAG: hypothetical protein JST10_09100 [Bacteroidetes bacterium]|nr:hypothetical protein [Bacteroidota bacterium]MBS1632716.1 hypothetical protein [Bacteroidota bacterium]
MKSMLLLFIGSIAIITITNSGCTKSNANNGCGCDSQPLQNITNILGSLSYSTKGTSPYNTTQKQYVITTGVPGLLSDYFVCDSSFLQLQSIIDTNRNIVYPVIFSGAVKKFCSSDTLFYLNLNYNIQLTNIQKR